MKNKINIAELLRNCPQGMELDCMMYEDVYFDYVDELNIIHCYIKNEGFRTSITFNQHGTPNSDIKSKCVIFPKGKTTWEGFVPPCKFKDGDVVISTSNNIHLISCCDKNYGGWESCCGIIYDKFDSTKTVHVIPTRLATEEEKQKLFDAIKANGYHWDTESKTLKNWTIQDAKDGDVVSYGNGWTCIFKCIHGIWFSSYCFITSDGEFHTGYEEHEVHTTINSNTHLATKEQCNLLFQKIKEAGYKWNAETKTLEKLPKFKVGDRIRHKDSGIYCTLGEYSEGISAYRTNIGLALTPKDLEQWELFPNKFDINTLKPFDKILVRMDNKHVWSIQFFERLNKLKDSFVCMGGVRYCQCIPYKGNEYLLNTTNDCDDFYKTWK